MMSDNWNYEPTIAAYIMKYSSHFGKTRKGKAKSKTIKRKIKMKKQSQRRNRK